MMIEYVSVGIAALLVGIFAGYFVSPFHRAQRENASMWRTQYLVIKKQLADSLQAAEDADPIVQLVSGLPGPLQLVARKALSDPNVLQGLLKQFGPLIQKYLSPEKPAEAAGASW